MQHYIPISNLVAGYGQTEFAIGRRNPSGAKQNQTVCWGESSFRFSTTIMKMKPFISQYFRNVVKPRLESVGAPPELNSGMTATDNKSLVGWSFAESVRSGATCAVGLSTGVIFDREGRIGARMASVVSKKMQA